MVKLTTLLTSFIALLFLVDASVYRTTVEVEDEEDIANPSYQTCREQIQNLSPCQEYIRQQVSGLGPSRGFNRRLRDCCNRLRGVQTQCRCDGLRMVVDQVRSRGLLRGEDVSQSYRMAQELPSICGLSTPSRCRFGPWVGF